MNPSGKSEDRRTFDLDAAQTTEAAQKSLRPASSQVSVPLSLSKRLFPTSGAAIDGSETGVLLSLLAKAAQFCRTPNDCTPDLVSWYHGSCVPVDSRESRHIMDPTPCRDTQDLPCIHLYICRVQMLRRSQLGAAFRDATVQRQHMLYYRLANTKLNVVVLGHTRWLTKAVCFESRSST